MSLDVHLESEEREVKCVCRDCSNEHTKKESEVFYESNITHNLSEMAGEAGIYEHLWRPEELGLTFARQLIEPLTEGLKKLKDNPEHYNKFNAPNGWGMYKHFVLFVEGYLNACVEHPDATIRVSR
jgi:hypothetical protein